MKKILIITLIGLTPILLQAQRKSADRLCDKWEYNKAAAKYEKAAAKKPSQDVYYRLGQCYQKMHRYAAAVTAYDKANAMGHSDDASFYLNYGLMLKANKRYSDAKNEFIVYSRMAPSDPRGAFYAASCDTITNNIAYDLPIKTKTVSALNSSSSDLCPVFYRDGVVFVSSREVSSHGSKIYGWDGEHYLDILYAKKGKNDSDFVSVSPLDGSAIHSKYHNGPVCFSRNFDTIYFNRVSKELKGKEKKTLNIERNKIYWAVYKDGNWSGVKPFQYNNDTFSVATPYLSRDGSKLYFASDMPGGYGGVDIYYCSRQGNGWSKPVNMGPNINTFGDEKFPSIDSAGNFYFSSDGYKGYGGMDICVAKYNNGNYGQAAVLKAPFNSAVDDYGITFKKTGKVGYFSSNRGSGNGDEDIYYFNMDKDNLPCQVATSEYVIGYRCVPKRELAVKKIDTVKHYVTTNTIATVTPIIHFDFDKYAIRPDAAHVLDSIARLMKKNSQMVIDLNGYCDSRGTVPYNETLSVHRSQAAENYLASKGISRSRMVPKGYGKTHFVNKCVENVPCTDDEQEQNRRVEMQFSNSKKSNVVSSDN